MGMGDHISNVMKGVVPYDIDVGLSQRGLCEHYADITKTYFAMNFR